MMRGSNKSNPNASGFCQHALEVELHIGGIVTGQLRTNLHPRFDTEADAELLVC